MSMQGFSKMFSHLMDHWLCFERQSQEQIAEDFEQIHPSFQSYVATSLIEIQEPCNLLDVKSSVHQKASPLFFRPLRL